MTWSFYTLQTFFGHFFKMCIFRLITAHNNKLHQSTCAVNSFTQSNSVELKLDWFFIVFVLHIMSAFETCCWYKSLTLTPQLIHLISLLILFPFLHHFALLLQIAYILAKVFLSFFFLLDFNLSSYNKSNTLCILQTDI